jgi:hypothetical protein
VSAWQYLWIPAIFGVALAALFAALVVLIGIPGAGPKGRKHWGSKFFGTSLFAASAWSFGDSWATSVTPVTALVGGLLTASGTVAGLIPGVDLGRFGLLMAAVGGITVVAPLLFAALNSLFPPEQGAADQAGQAGLAGTGTSTAETATAAAGSTQAGEVAEARLWVMVVASCLTVFAVGAELGIVGWVLGHDLVVASPLIRWCAPVVAVVTGLLFLGYGVHSIVMLAARPDGTPKQSAKAHSFML